MTHFSIVHELECSPEEFWPIFFDKAYNDELYDRIGVRERKMLKFDEDEQAIHFTLRVMPKRDLPGIIKKVVGGDLGYTEISTYHKGKNTIDVRIEPTLLKERTKITARYTIESIGARRVRRTFAGDIHVDIPLVGRKIEATVLDDVRRSYGIAAQVTNEWAKRGK